MQVFSFRVVAVANTVHKGDSCGRACLSVCRLPPNASNSRQLAACSYISKQVQPDTSLGECALFVFGNVAISRM